MKANSSMFFYENLKHLEIQVQYLSDAFDKHATCVPNFSDLMIAAKFKASSYQQELKVNHDTSQGLD